VTEFPALELALAQAARRRYGWRRWRSRAAPALIAAAAAGVVLLVARPPARDDERPVDVRWTTTSVPRYGYRVSLPAGWQLARRPVTRLVDPREIMTAATFDAVPRGTLGCGPFPAVALSAGDALVSVTERAGVTSYAQRPAHFARAPVSPLVVSAVRRCTSTDGVVSLQDFSEGLRSFDALVVIDARAPASVRSQAFAILDRMQFDRAFVPWWTPFR
jgi:hypothetical protein